MTAHSQRRVHRLVVDGVDLAVEETGRGPPVLFIHGFPLDRTIWRHQLDHLGAYRCIAPDLRGMGASGSPEEGYAIAQYATDLVRVLDQLGVSRAGVCGLSMGGYIALEFASRFRDRVASMVLMDTRAEADSPAAAEARIAMAQRARNEGLAAVTEEMLPKLLAPESLARNDLVVASVRQMMRATPLAGFLGALQAMRSRVDYRGSLAALGPTPTMVVVGAQDAITPPALARTLAAAIPGAKLVEVPGAGHLVPMEQPETTTQLLREFWRSVKPSEWE